MNPYIVGGAAALLLGGGFTAGWRVNGWRIEAQEAAMERAAQLASQAATEAAVTAIGKIEVRNVTIRQQAETVTREVPVYRECRHDPAGLSAVNQALAGALADPAGVPAAGDADGR